MARTKKETAPAAEPNQKKLKTPEAMLRNGFEYVELVINGVKGVYVVKSDNNGKAS